MFQKIFILVAICAFHTSLFAQQQPATENPTQILTDEFQQKIDKSKPTQMKKPHGLLFPKWQRPGLGIILNLQGGQVQTSDFSGLSISDNAIFEFNGIAGLRNLPIIPGNPGLYISPEIAYGKGFRVSEGFDTERYDRWWYGGSVTALNGPIKLSLGVHQGIVDWASSSIDDSKVIQGSGNIGVRIIPLLNIHNDMVMRVYYSDEFKDPTSREFNNWLYAHTRMRLFNLSIKAGPGVKFVTFYNESSKNKGSLSYGKVQGSADIFWKLGMDMHGNYVFNDSLSSFQDRSVSDQLPLQTSNSGAEDVILPKDTLDYTFFIGARNLFDGLTVGWKYNIRILNALERDGDKQVSKEHGVHFTYSLNVNGV